MNLTKTDKASLLVHGGPLIVVGIAALLSAYTFWDGLFQNGIIALALIGAIEGMAVLGLYTYVAGISSPYTPVRKVFPALSISFVAIEAYLWLTTPPRTLDWQSATALAVFVWLLGAWLLYKSLAQVETVLKVQQNPAEQAQRLAQERYHLWMVEVANEAANQSVREQMARQVLQLEDVTPTPSLPQQRAEVYHFPEQPTGRAAPEATNAPAPATAEERLNEIARAYGTEKVATMRKFIPAASVAEEMLRKRGILPGDITSQEFAQWYTAPNPSATDTGTVVMMSHADGCSTCGKPWGSVGEKGGATRAARGGALKCKVCREN